ncbi:MAG TPA: hypothetical protein VFG47_21515 [Geminicoccaceae bacterium]|nr:hypothetical protein [Geminicoccaceae bacterium]
MARLDKLLANMPNNPRGDWRVEQLKVIADRLGITHRQPGSSHVVFAPPGRPVLPVPAARPVKPAYIRKFIAMIDAMREGGDGAET